ncbi:MAG: relaxase/mobilization nuclease domain-containing protein [Chryseolinea sp.]
MVAKVISGKDIQGALNYNEQKVMEGNATCIQANLFKKDVDQLNFYDKLNRFGDLNDRNRRTKTNTLHISLNFDVTEKLSVDDLNKIASGYMDKIGFGNQPYLVYEHRDAAHPHVHIATTLIQENGKRIPIHYLGKNQSEKARKEIELEFGLVQAQSKSREQKEVIAPVDVKKAVYGKSETRRSISNIVRMVTRSYKYTSLPELNAILHQYNVHADRGTEKSQMFAKRGLMYSLIDDRQKRVGIPVKASAIHGKPTLSFLEKQFKLNEALRQPFKESVRKKIDNSLRHDSITSKQLFSEALSKKNVKVLFRTNAEGRTYGVTFIDNNLRVVFNGSDLGKAYGANAILEKISANADIVKPFRPGYTKISLPRDEKEEKSDPSIVEVISDLVTANEIDFSSPEAALKLPRRRKRRRGYSL